MPPKKKRSTRIADCCVTGCDERAQYVSRTFAERVPTHCEQHAKPRGDFFKFNRLCEVETCMTRASFAPTRESKKPCRCAVHKLPTDINWEKKICATENCDKKPSFAPPGKPAVRCKACRIGGDVDVNNDRCIECHEHQVSALIIGRESEGMQYCLTCAAKLGFEYKNGRVPYCVRCKTAVARFGTVGGRPRDAKYCGQCRDSNIHFDLVHDMCEVCEATRPQLRNGRRLCLRCCINVFPDMKVARNYKLKQNAVDDFLKERFADRVTIRHDRKIERIVPEAASAGAGGGFVPQEFEDERPCASSGRKPDVLIDMGEWVVVVEVDEGQHKQDSYKTSCENKRTMQIFDDLGRRPTVFIRFNPDNYVDAAGNKVKSPWTDDRRIKSGGVQHVPVKNMDAWQARLTTLASAVEHAMSNRPSKDVTNVYLYFDDY